MELQKLLSYTRKAVDEYRMIEEGDHIAVGISGGKDSLTLLYALHGLKRFYPKKFELSAITVDLGFEDFDLSPIQALCQELNIPYRIESSDIYEILFHVRKESNPCSLCAKMRKGALNQAIKEMGCNKIADLSVLLGERVLHFPARDYVLLDVDGASGEFEHQRLGVLSELLQGTARVVVASAESACERTIPKETLKDSILTIDMDGSYDQEQVVKKLVAMGYQCRDQVEGICQFARRGGILDIFPPDRMTRK